MRARLVTCRWLTVRTHIYKRACPDIWLMDDLQDANEHLRSKDKKRYICTIMCTDWYELSVFHTSESSLIALEGEFYQQVVIGDLYRVGISVTGIICETNESAVLTSSFLDSCLRTIHACSLVQGRLFESSKSSPNAFLRSSTTPRLMMSSTASFICCPLRTLRIS